MSSVLARLQQQTQQMRDRQNRKIFVSSDTVQAYRVAHERKELLTREHPLVLAMPDDYSSSSTLDMIDASVGPDLKWTLTNINHILRTVSKYGEPTYLFANILDNDPQAFVAVTLRKGTPAEELEHLDSVLGRVSQLHVSDKKPKQVPDAGDVINAVGKGLMGLLGISSGKSNQEKREERGQQRRQEEADRAAAAADRTAAARAGGAGLATTVNVHGRPVYDTDTGTTPPSAPLMYGGSDYRAGAAASHQAEGRPAMGVTDKKQAENRLAALKAELAREGAPPSAPDLRAAPEDTTRDRVYTPAAAAPPHTYQQQQQQRGSWEAQARQPGVLSNPYSSTDSYDSYRTAGGGYAPSAPAAGSDILLNTEPYGSDRDRPAGGRYYPNLPSDILVDQPLPEYRQGYGSSSSRDDYGARDNQAGSYNSPAGYDRYDTRDAPKPGERGYEDHLRKLQRQAQAGAASGAPDLTARDAGYVRDYVTGAGAGVDNPKKDYGSALQREAEEARLEWERTQREAAERAKAAAARDDGGWGSAGKDQRQQQQQQGKKKDAPSWLEVLGTVFAGGPAYNMAPDL